VKRVGKRVRGSFKSLVPGPYKESRMESMLNDSRSLQSELEISFDKVHIVTCGVCSTAPQYHIDIPSFYQPVKVRRCLTL